MIVIVVAAMATCPYVFQIATAVLSLAAVLAVLAFGIAQLVLRVADSLLALSVIVVIAIQCPRGDRSAQERTDHKGRNECSRFFKHP